MAPSTEVGLSSITFLGVETLYHGVVYLIFCFIIIYLTKVLRTDISRISYENVPKIKLDSAATVTTTTAKHSPSPRLS